MNQKNDKIVNTIEDFERLALETALYPNRGNNLYYPTLGLGGETGEVLEKVKKFIRDSSGIMNESFRQDIKKELGDVAWYLVAICNEVGLTFREVLQANINKVHDRMKRETINGDGDNR